MDMPTAGIVTIAFSLLLSRKLGWHADPARIPLLIATVLFAFALCFPTIGALEQETGWIVAGHVATALGRHRPGDRPACFRAEGCCEARAPGA